MRKLLLLSFCFSFISLVAEVRLPAIFSNDMVVQRDESFIVWGWADKGERIEVEFVGQKRNTKTDKNGKWQVLFPPMQYGGEYKMTIKGKGNTIVLTNILIGDVWVCSGQSNMEWLLKSARDAEYEIEDANYPKIRSFNVKRDMELTPQDDFSGRWEVCTPKTAKDFSAVGYFFARKIHQETGIPIGFINTSWGGSKIEVWTSPESFFALPDKYKKDFDFDPSMLSESNLQKMKESKLKYEEALKNDIGLREKWYDITTDISTWNEFRVPKSWDVPGLSDIDGVVWFQYEFTLPSHLAGKEGKLSLAKIDDNDETFINGIKIGAKEGYNISRNYKIPSGILKAGKNRISVRIVDNFGGGGIYGEDKDVFIDVQGEVFSLAGEWNYKVAESNKKYGYVGYSPNTYPTSLYNAMIHPMLKFPIKGAIWYQGESNADKAYDYRTLFPNMIKDWRSKWGKEFPFYWVQLANYKKQDDEPKDSEWAELREAQTMTLSLPKTGEAVTIDIGEADDIHPRNKQDVGLRLALNALNKEYGRKDIVYSGPMYKSYEKQGNKIIITFDTFGSELVTDSKYGYLTGFTIAGADKKFVWAKADILNGKVTVYSDEIEDPVAVRYNWGNNPDGNLYNKVNLPACPFRTDKWKGITE